MTEVCIREANHDVSTSIDGDLADWSTLADKDWSTLLLGNGLSMNLWAGFGYKSLYAAANLSAEAKAIFDELGTTNFEQGLECLHHANVALRALREPTTLVDATYEQVRDALFNTVGDVHVPWDDFPPDTHDHIATQIDQFVSVFTTSYDLNLYWSHMWAQYKSTKVTTNIVDLFWAGDRFDPTNCDVWSSKATRVLYLHGGLHLWQDDQTGENGKWTHASDGRLLDLKSKYGPASDRRPLFVSEGTWSAKSRTIRQSSYLSFCLDELRTDESATVVFGQALADQDRHILTALNEGSRRRIAISMYPTGDDEAVVEEKARLLQALRGHKVEFFDSTTHPLGDPAVLITP